MMEATQHREGRDFPRTSQRTSGLLRLLDPLVDALMRSRAIEIPHVLFMEASQMGFAYDQHVIAALAAHAPQQSFTNRVRVWCLDRRSEHLEPGSDRDGLAVRAIFRIWLVPLSTPRNTENK
jgi:hypothetical protein